MQKTDVSNSPMLKPVMERSYTQGLAADTGQTTQQSEPINDTSQQEQPKDGAGKPTPPPTQQQFNIPKDGTKEFSFDQTPEGASDVGEGDTSEGLSISSASAKTFANFVGDAIQMYLPKATYSYSKIDIENVIVNIQKGLLTNNWLDAFTAINKATEEALKISDDSIKMWKKAFKDYLESENITFANPKTALILATLLLLVDQGVKAHQIKKSNEEYMKQALEHSNPNVFQKKVKETEKTETNAKAA